MFESLPPMRIVVGILAVWRITHLLYGEDGPGDVFVRLRRLAGRGFFGRLLDCFHCLSLWVAVPFAWALAHDWGDRGLLWLALSGGAILSERATASPPSVPPPAVWREEPLQQPQKEENPNHVVLR